jgi:hypothetical protein
MTIVQVAARLHKMTATITDIEIVNGKDTDLQIDRRVYAINLSDVSEV